MNKFSIQLILEFITMRVYPRSLAGLSLKKAETENKFQLVEIETLLDRMAMETFAHEAGWEWMRRLISRDFLKSMDLLAGSSFVYEKVYLNQNFTFVRPLTITGAFRSSSHSGVFFHQMILDRIENNEYIIQNNQPTAQHSIKLCIPMTKEYFVDKEAYNRFFDPTTNVSAINDKKTNVFAPLTNEDLMEKDTWYLLPQAYSIEIQKAEE
ncbi:Oidioi.mRNA.OKI2018_I69.chr2.g6531.t1.cds [Oikopleura dioica]|uniref:Oidioi.mRNA.OKI2018_I69.chr2.g6531.t1.cds n=1 Tax=Oikopleura dioica TaxID=34765 RepID=A0ABN7T6Y2_OIKDI|nr:Oidioi.mRNA.OKI2018_I69.chr2.g6531.t1.cds [Oikopleura dioica]